MSPNPIESKIHSVEMTFSYGFCDYLAKRAAHGDRFNSTFSLKQKTAYYISEGLDFF